MAEANAEAIAALPAGGTVVPARGGAREPYLGRDDVAVRRFDPEDVERRDGTTRFALDGLIELDLPFTQRHHAVNALAALHAYAALGLPLERAADSAGAIQLSPGADRRCRFRRRAR